jgi:Tfp pilus assembly protein PilE
MQEFLSKSDKQQEDEVTRKTAIRQDHAVKGFTLVELIVMIMLLSTLAAVAVQKYADVMTDAGDASAKALLAALRTANDLVYAKKQIDAVSPAYTMGDVAAFIENLHVEHINYSNQDMKWHVRITGREYWYTLSSPGTGMPSITEWKHDDW